MINFLGAKGQLLVLEIKFYRNIAVPICLDIVSGYFYATVAELNSCNKDLIAWKVWNIYIFINADLGI